MDTKALAEKLGINENTLRSWERELDINVPRGNRNRRKYDDNLVHIFEKIKELREVKDAGFTTIKRTLNHTEFSTNQTELKLNSVSKEDFLKIVEISEKLSQASYMLGKYESENKALQEKIKLLPAPDEFEKLKQDNNVLKTQVEVLSKELEYHKKPWWKKIFI